MGENHSGFLVDLEDAVNMNAQFCVSCIYLLEERIYFHKILKGIHDSKSLI